VQRRTAVDPVGPNLIAYAERVATRTFSTLQRISDDEFDRGASELRRSGLQEDRGQPVEKVIDTFLFRRAESVPLLRSGRCEGGADELHHRP